jgi:hypothetical protein
VIAHRRAVLRDRVRCLVRSRRSTTLRHAWVLFSQRTLLALSRFTSHRHPRQISPSKNMNYPCTTAAFTLSAVSGGLRHEVLTRPQTEPSMQFLSVGSHVCTPASFGQSLAVLPLPSASGYPCRMRQVGYSHRGLPPHQFMPMSGAHPSLQRTAQRRTASELFRSMARWQLCKRKRPKRASFAGSTVERRLLK